MVTLKCHRHDLVDCKLAAAKRRSRRLISVVVLQYEEVEDMHIVH